MADLTDDVARWVRYHAHTEDFDRSLPGRWSDLGTRATWLVDPRYRRDSARYAVRAMRVFMPPNEQAAKRHSLELTERLHGRSQSATDVFQALGMPDTDAEALRLVCMHVAEKS